MMIDKTSDMHEKLTQELRRGILVLATLSQLHEAKYGYALIDELSRRGLEIDQGTLYPLLPCIPCFGDWKTRDCWRVNGMLKVPARDAITE